MAVNVDVPVKYDLAFGQRPVHVAPVAIRPDVRRVTRSPHPAQHAALDPLLLLFIARSKKMLWTIAVILLVIWALGMATSYTASGLIHLLLVVALVVMVLRIFQGRRITG
jgi:hypothetical protein